MGLPFQKQIQNQINKAQTTIKKKRKDIVNTTPDQDRLERESNYMRRIRMKNPKVKRLHNRLKNRGRKSYGR